MKKYILIAGVNGAGKSTLYQTLESLKNMGCKKLKLSFYSLFCFNIFLFGRFFGIQHILNENSVARCGIINKNVGDSTYELAVLNYW